MTRPALTPLMLPTSLQPPLTGPRDVAHGTVHRIADDDHNTPPATTPKGKPMPASPSQDAILAALKKKTPADVDYIERVTGIKRSTLSPTFTLMKARGRIESSPHQRAVYGLPGTDWGTGTTKAKPATKRPPKAAPESFAAGVAQIEREQASTGTNGTDLDAAKLARGLALLDQPFTHQTGRTALPCRAIAKADGGAIILRGNQLTAELCAEELNVIHQLRG